MEIEKRLHRHSGDRTELLNHKNNGNFTENPNLMVPRASLAFFEEFIFRARLASRPAGRPAGRLASRPASQLINFQKMH